MSHNPKSYKNWYERNRERVIAKTIAYRKAHPDRIREYQRRGRLKRLEKVRAYDREWKKKHRPLVAAAKRRANLRRHGLTVAQREAMEVAQGGRCAICQLKTRLVVDHDHDTGMRRELLCNACNRGIGLLRDNLWILERAKAYLMRHIMENNPLPQLVGDGRA